MLRAEPVEPFERGHIRFLMFKVFRWSIATTLDEVRNEAASSGDNYNHVSVKQIGVSGYGWIMT